jgi:hypothetical protein
MKKFLKTIFTIFIHIKNVKLRDVLFKITKLELCLEHLFVNKQHFRCSNFHILIPTFHEKK